MSNSPSEDIEQQAVPSKRQAKMLKLRARLEKSFGHQKSIMLNSEEVTLLAEIGAFALLDKEISLERTKECKRRSSIEEANIISHSISKMTAPRDPRISTSSGMTDQQDGSEAVRQARRQLSKAKSD